MKSTEKEYWQLVWDKFRNGDREAFQTIYNEFIDALFSYGSRITSDRDLLKDAIQDLFIDIYTYGAKLRQPELLEFYLFKSLKRNLIKKLKETQRYSPTKEILENFDLQFAIEDENYNVETDQKLKLLQDELIHLEPSKKELLFLKFNSGLSYEEIGQLLDMKPATVKKQVYRLLNYIRGKLDTSSFELFVMCFRA